MPFATSLAILMFLLRDMIEIYAVFFLYNHKTCWNLKQLFSLYRFLCLGHLFCKFSLHLMIDLLCSRYKLADKGMRFDNNNLCNSLKTFRGAWRLGRSHDLGWGKHRPWAQSTTSTHTHSSIQTGGRSQLTAQRSTQPCTACSNVRRCFWR